MRLKQEWEQWEIDAEEGGWGQCKFDVGGERVRDWRGCGRGAV